jgi:succinate dehydrogenase (ubiquinone) cytochrome b560 subunit
LRHLAWDTASMINNKQVQQTGWFVVGLSVVSSLALAFL